MSEEEHDAPKRAATVAIVGRPNVGKSALFNRIIGRRLAIVDDLAGVTRDRLYARTEWQGRVLNFVDTGGIDSEEASHDTIWAQTREQAQIAAQRADLILFLVDGSTGLHPLDEEIAALVRRLRRPLLLVANKLESQRAREAAAGEFARLGFGSPIGVSAIHGEGTGDLLDAVIAALPEQAEATEEESILSLAVVGRPNVGKSSLVNALLGEERTIVADTPGTTRDAIDTLFTYHDETMRLIDTAGIWRKSRAHSSLDYYASLRSYQALERADVVLLVIDSMQGILGQERRLAAAAIEAGAGLIVVANKWDLARELGEFQQAELIEVIRSEIPFAAFAPVTFLSALTRRRLGSLMPLVRKVAENRRRRMPTARVNTVIREAVLAHPPPTKNGHPIRITYASQVATAPPKFLFFCNDPETVADGYRRYLERVLRTNEDFEGVPLNLAFRNRRVEEPS